MAWLTEMFWVRLVWRCFSFILVELTWARYGPCELQRFLPSPLNMKSEAKKECGYYYHYYYYYYHYCHHSITLIISMGGGGWVQLSENVAPADDCNAPDIQGNYPDITAHNRICFAQVLQGQCPAPGCLN